MLKGKSQPQSFEILMLVLTLASVVIAILMYLPEIEFSNDELWWIYVLDFVFVVALALDFSLRAKRSEKGAKKYVLTHVYELPAMLPLFFFGAIEDQVLVGAAIRSLRLLRLIRLLRLANLFRSLNGLRQSGFIYFAIIFTATIIFGSIAIYAVELEQENTTIKTYEDAVWFSITSTMISGYGDVYPSTTEGRVVAVVLSFLGLALILGFFASIGAAVFASRTQAKANDPKSMIKRQIDNIENLSTTEIEKLSDMIKDLHKKPDT